MLRCFFSLFALLSLPHPKIFAKPTTSTSPKTLLFVFTRGHTSVHADWVKKAAKDTTDDGIKILCKKKASYFIKNIYSPVCLLHPTTLWKHPQKTREKWMAVSVSTSMSLSPPVCHMTFKTMRYKNSHKLYIRDSCNNSSTEKNNNIFRRANYLVFA